MVFHQRSAVSGQHSAGKSKVRRAESLPTGQAGGVAAISEHNPQSSRSSLSLRAHTSESKTTFNSNFTGGEAR